MFSAYDIINKSLSRDPYYIVAMRPKFGNSSVSITEVIITSVSRGFD